MASRRNSAATLKASDNLSGAPPVPTIKPELVQVVPLEARVVSDIAKIDRALAAGKLTKAETESFSTLIASSVVQVSGTYQKLGTVIERIGPTMAKLWVSYQETHPGETQVSWCAKFFDNTLQPGMTSRAAKAHANPEGVRVFAHLVGYVIPKGKACIELAESIASDRKRLEARTQALPTITDEKARAQEETSIKLASTELDAGLKLPAKGGGQTDVRNKKLDSAVDAFRANYAQCSLTVGDALHRLPGWVDNDIICNAVSVVISTAMQTCQLKTVKEYLNAISVETHKDASMFQRVLGKLKPESAPSLATRPAPTLSGGTTTIPPVN